MSAITSRPRLARLFDDRRMMVLTLLAPVMLFIASLGGWGSARTVSTKDGSFELRDLPPREYRITIRGAGFAEKSLPAITVTSGKTTDLGTITVHAGRSISGRVVDAQGSPVAGATVLAAATLWGTGSKASAPAGMGGPPGSGTVKEATTDERGEFVITGVGRGPRHLVADHDTIGRSVQLMKELGIVDSGDALKLGIGAMRPERVQAFYDQMVRAGLYKPGEVDLSKVATYSFVNHGTGLADKQRLLGH